jgi:hypothetical protein
MGRKRVETSEDRSNDLNRRQMVDGGEIVSGSLANEALDAVGARAMTVDRTIFVRDDFDADNPEDQALYAHERHHQLQSGGDHAHGGGEDAEEAAAKAIERMVLHRRAGGEDFGSIMGDVRAGRTSPADAPHESGAAENSGGDDDNNPMGAYHALRAKGMTHDAIVRMLARHVLHEMHQGDHERKERAPIGPGSFRG